MQRRRGVCRGVRPDHVGKGLGPVEEAPRRFERLACRLVVLLRLRLGRDPVEGAARTGARAADDVAGPAEDGAGRGAAHEQRAADEDGAADDRRPGLADEGGERAAESKPDDAARVAAEQDHEAEERHAEPEAERADVEQVAPRELEPADDEQRERERVCRPAEHGAQQVREPRAHGAAVEAEVEDGREDEPERREGEPEELALVMRSCPAPRPLLHARGHARTQRPPSPPTARHARAIRRAGIRSCRRQAVARARASSTTRSASARFP